MKIRIRKRYIAAAAINAAVLTAIALLTAAGGSMARSQSYNMAAQRWGSESDEKFVQMSCYFSDDAGFSEGDLRNVYGQMLGRLNDVSIAHEEGQKLIAEAYSAPLGRLSVKCDLIGRSDAEVTAVGGDFFLFHDFRLVSGAFFSSDDIMQDGAVIDKELAWALYGSSDIAGKNIYINDVKLYIAGVIEQPSTSAEEKCMGELPRAYVSYETAGQVVPLQDGMTFSPDNGMSGGATSAEASFSRISCYECILPEPVDSFAEITVEGIFKEQYRGKVDIVNNTGRFDPKKRAKAFGKLYQSVIREDSIRYPFWENASRIVEFRLSCIYGARRLLTVIPVVTGIWLLLKGLLLLRRKKGWLRRILSGLAEKLRKKIRKNPVTPDNMS